MDNERNKEILSYMAQIKRKYKLKATKQVNPNIEKGYASLTHNSFPNDVDISMGIRPDGIPHLYIGSQFNEYGSYTWGDTWTPTEIKEVINEKIGNFMRLKDKRDYSSYR